MNRELESGARSYAARVPTESLIEKIARRPEWIGATVLVLAFLCAIIAIGPVHDFPVEDDWDYSRMAKIFAETGQIQRSDYAQATLIFPALYGGLISKIFGFSFTTLRFSTLALALVALLAFYALLGELNFDVTRRVLGTLTLLVSPVFVYLGFSFMTDVPAFTWLILAVLFYVRAFKRDDARQALIASTCAALCFLTRQIGIFLPLAFGAVVLWRFSRTLWLKYLAAGCLLPLAVVAIYVVADRQSTTNWATQNITLQLTASQLFEPDWWGVYVRRAVQSLMTIGIYLAPLLVAMVWGITGAPRRFARARLLVYALVGGIFVVSVARMASRGDWFPYLTDILTRAGMRPYLAYYAWDAGALRGEILPHAFFIALTLLATVAGLALTYFAAQKIRRAWLRGEAKELQFIFVLTLLIAVPSFIFATFYERYLLPLLPGASILLLDASRRARFSLRAAGPSLTVIAICSWALMQDYWNWNEARWQVGRALLAQNIPASKIDAGYEWDGWYLYDATIDYIRTTGKPFIYDPWQYVLDPEWVLAFQPLPNYHIERVIEFATPFADGKIYLQKRN
jgi:4-amino-4-deoxy-L-arabinose transferase-like glycosyltransferase